MKPCEVIEPYFEYMGLRLRDGDTRSVVPLSVFCLHDYNTRMSGKGKIICISRSFFKPLAVKKRASSFLLWMTLKIVLKIALI